MWVGRMGRWRITGRREDSSSHPHVGPRIPGSASDLMWMLGCRGSEGWVAHTCPRWVVPIHFALCYLSAENHVLAHSVLRFPSRLELYRKVPNLRILACGGDGTVGPWQRIHSLPHPSVFLTGFPAGDLSLQPKSFPCPRVDSCLSDERHNPWGWEGFSCHGATLSPSAVHSLPCTTPSSVAG